jgi:hypothetical protein
MSIPSSRWYWYFKTAWASLQRYLVGEAVDYRVDETGGPAEDVGDKMENAVLRRRHWVHHWKQQMIMGRRHGNYMLST